MHSFWLGLCLLHLCTREGGCLRAPELLWTCYPCSFEAIQSQVSRQGELPSRGSTGTAVMLVGPPRQADETASTLCCGCWHGGASAACSSVSSSRAVACLPTAAAKVGVGFTTCVAIPAHPSPPSSCPLLPCYALTAPQARALKGPLLFLFFFIIPPCLGRA